MAKKTNSFVRYNRSEHGTRRRRKISAIAPVAAPEEHVKKPTGFEVKPEDFENSQSNVSIATTTKKTDAPATIKRKGSREI